MASLARIPLDDGGYMLFEAPAVGGPVKASGLGDTIRELPQTLGSLLEPVKATGQVLLDHLKAAGPGELEVEFGLDLTAQAGVVIAKTGTACHLKVKLKWKKGQDDES
ncbi:CU044_2847 family protein [Catenulispora rubra]|uniref:CU044_2847 family protein n=1 Tax=Catenulispora rubra TaxID=280293 RepID=UPI0018925F8F|nr:CU044_2847 family protein [Catenulispora rubra]